ncbi:hypothetical protein ACFWEO_16355, partial [Streptomyces roseolus]
MTAGTGPVLHGRDVELALVRRMSNPSEGRGGAEPVVLVAGGPGEGRSVLLARAARDFPGAAHVVGAPRRQVPWSAARALLDALAPS